jgi:UPF0716 protein FxsA
MALKKWVVVPYVDDRTGGFASGRVYVGGFPGDGDEYEEYGAWGTGDEGPDPGFETGNGREVHDLDEDAYDVDVEDVRDER